MLNHKKLERLRFILNVKVRWKIGNSYIQCDVIIKYFKSIDKYTWRSRQHEVRKKTRYYIQSEVWRWLAGGSTTGGGERREEKSLQWEWAGHTHRSTQSVVIMLQNSVKFTWPSPSMSASEGTCQPIFSLWFHSF